MPDLMSDSEKREALEKINGYYGSELTTDYMLLRKKEKDGMKIFIYSGSELPKLPAEWVGLHLATINNEGVSLSIEGAQLVGKTASRNVVEITRAQAEDLMKGLDLGYDGELRGNVIVRTPTAIVGVCKADEGKITNTLPKSRRTVRYRKGGDEAD